MMLMDMIEMKGLNMIPIIRIMIMIMVMAKITY